MAILINDNYSLQAENKAFDARYLDVNMPWADSAAANAGIPTYRYTGLTINVAGDEWWWKDGTGDSDLIQKSLGGTSILSGATNGLSLINGGASVVLGGALTGETKIDGNGHGIVFGNATSCATGTSALAQGYGVCAYGNYSHAEGDSTIAYCVGSHAEGCGTITSGNTSHAEGCNTRTYGNHSHAEGHSSCAIGNYSHSEGGNNNSCGFYSHAEGRNTITCGNYSHAEGLFTIAEADYQHASGMYNIGCTTTIAEIGVGSGSTTRCNAFEVYSNGGVAMPELSAATQTNMVYIDSNGLLSQGSVPSSNIVDVCNVNTTYTATTSNDFIGVSGATCIYLPATPKACQRITVADIEGDALTNSITVDGNGIDINGADYATINTDYGSMTFINNNVSGWSAVAFIN